MKRSVLILLLIISMLSSGCVGELSKVSLKLTESKEDRQLNDKQVEIYLNTFGVIKNKLKLRYIGDFTTTQIRGVYGDNYRTWIRAYEIRAPFMEKPFEVWIDNRTHEIFGNNFYEVLSTDAKFQHLYSEWVKRQIGCEDENVELGFYGQQSNPKLIILFNQISNLNNNYEEIFKNTYNFYLNTISIKHLRDLNEQNSYDIALMETSEYVNRIKKMIGTPPFKFSYGIRLSNNEFLKEDVNIFYRCNYKDNSKLERSKW